MESKRHKHLMVEPNDKNTEMEKDVNTHSATLRSKQN